MKYNNNPKNRQGLLDYQRRQLELSRLTEVDARKRIIESNVDKWINNLPRELKSALPQNLPKDVINKIKIVNLKPPHDKHIIISSEDVTVARFVAYSILYALIDSGISTPSEIRTTNVLDGYNNINGMFNARAWKENFFEARSKVLVIEGCSKSLSELGNRGEEQFWRELTELAINNDKIILVTYATDEEERNRGIFIPSLTSDKNLNSKLIKKSVFVPLNTIEEREIKNE